MSQRNEPTDMPICTPVSRECAGVNEPAVFEADFSAAADGVDTLGMKPCNDTAVGECAENSSSTTPSSATLPAATVPGVRGMWRRFLARTYDLVERVMPYGGFASSCFSLCTVTLGGGIIGMPSAFHTSGLVMALIYLFVVMVLTSYSMVILAYAMEKTGFDTFEHMAYGLFGRGGDYFVGFVMWLSCFGTAIAYISGVSSCLSPLLTTESAPAYLKTESGNRLMTSLVWLVCMCPLIIPKELNSLRYFSAFSVTFVLFFVLAVVIHSCTHGLPRLSEHRSELRMFNTNGPESINGFSLFVFAFLCQGCAYPTFFEARPKPDVKRFAWETLIAMTVCMFFYILAGVFGYLDFGASVEGSVLYNYDPAREPLMLVAYIGILIKLSTAFFANFIPIRNFVYYCVRWELATIPYWKHTITVLFLSVLVLVCGLFIPTIDLAFELVGGFCGGFIGFIFPALFWMYCGRWSLKTVGWFHYVMTYLLIIVGVIAVVFGTAASIYFNFFDGDDDSSK